MNLRNFVRGVGLGAAWMYFWDPRSGKGRRAELRDRCLHLYRKASVWLEKAERDFTNRAQGILSETRRLFLRPRGDDDLVARRVRARMGHVAEHPRSIGVKVKGGKVSLSGTVYSDEEGRIIATVSSVPGVEKVESRLEPHARERAGLGTRNGGPRGAASNRWPPATRLVLGGAGGLLVAGAFARPNLPRTLLGMAGAAVLLRSMTNRPLDEMIRGHLPAHPDKDEPMGENDQIEGE